MQHLKNLFTASILVASLFLAGKGATAQQFYVPNSDTNWVREQESFRIAGNLYYVGTYELASYLITTPKGHILINTGIPGSDTMIRRHVETLGFNFSDIKILLTTQAHFDHVGAMAAVKQETGAKLMIDEKDGPAMEDGDNSDYAMGGHGPTFQPVKPDRLLHDKEMVKLDGMRVMLLHHPGHTKGSCSYLFTVKDSARAYRVLIANMPSIITEAKFSTLSTYPGISRDYAYTLDTMPKLQFDIWLASHNSQFDLHKKHKVGDGYHPEAFFDRAGYDSSLEELQKAYLKKEGKNSSM